MTSKPPPGPAKALGWLALALYSPYAWLLLKDWPWRSHHWGWIQSWPGLPAMRLRTMFWNQYEFATEVALMYITTAVGLGLLTFVAKRSQRAMWTTVAAVLVFSLLNSGYCRALYLM